MMPKEFIVFDTEYTAWEGSLKRGWNGENEYKEIVQIGAVRVKDLVEIDSLLLYVKPEINPELSEYFKALTKITQAEVDEEGVSLVEAMDKLSCWSDGLTFYSYGPDGDVVRANADLMKVEFPFTNDFRDVRKVFYESGIDTVNYMSSTIPKAFGIVPPPDGHDALNDARSILIALQAM